MKTTTYILPAYWASALVNADESGMENKEIEEMNAWLDSVKPGSCVGCSDNEYFAHSNAANSLGGDVLEFYFHKQETTHTPGPWNMHEYGEAVFAKGKRICVTATQVTSASAEDKANARLIAAAPLMIQQLHNTYVSIQRMVQNDLNEGSSVLAFRTDFLRASLRNTISEATGIDCETLQNEVEQLARAISKAEGHE
jgi:hypothetical protein